MLKNYLITHLETGESDLHVGYSPSEIITGTHQEEWDDQTPVRVWNPNRDVYSVVGMVRSPENPVTVGLVAVTEAKRKGRS